MINTSILKILLLFIIPTFFAAIFPGNSGALRQIKHFLNCYPYYVLLSEKSNLNKLLFRLVSKTKNNKIAFIYYIRIAYVVLAILQIPIAIICFLNPSVFELYFIILLALCIVPYILFVIFVGILENKEKIYKKKNGINVESFWEILKSDKEFNALEKQIKQQNFICKAVKPYIRMTNPKKRKRTIVVGDIDKVNSILEKSFPKAYTEITIDEKGNKVFCVYFKEKEDKLLIKAFVKNR